jgi:hypothetical protein
MRPGFVGEPGRSISIAVGSVKLAMLTVGLRELRWYGNLRLKRSWRSEGGRLYLSKLRFKGHI